VVTKRLSSNIHQRASGTSINKDATGKNVTEENISICLLYAPPRKGY